MASMFAYDRALQRNYVFMDQAIDNVKPNTNMFTGCNVLTGENGTRYNASHAAMQEQIMPVWMKTVLLTTSPTKSMLAILHTTKPST